MYYYRYWCNLVRFLSIRRYQPLLSVHFHNRNYLCYTSAKTVNEDFEKLKER